MKRLILTLSFVLTATPSLADGYVPVTDQSTFLSLVENRELRNFFYGIKLNVLGNGQIQGRAVGWDVTGSWSWQDGYFCREMNWGGDPIPYNCQLVEVEGNDRMRFTVDRGAGDSASFRLR